MASKGPTPRRPRPRAWAPHGGLALIAEGSASNEHLFGKLYGTGMAHALAL